VIQFCFSVGLLAMNVSLMPPSTSTMKQLVHMELVCRREPTERHQQYARLE